MGDDIRARFPDRLSRIFANAGLAALLIFLSACAAAPDGAGEAAASGDSAGKESAAGNEPDVIPVVQAPPASESANAPAPAQTAARVVRADELVGKKDSEIADLLGKPNLVRHDRQAQVWQYQGPTCVLDLFLYPAPESKNADADQSGESAVVYFETRGKDAKRVSGDRCISELVSARGGAG